MNKLAVVAALIGAGVITYVTTESGKKEEPAKPTRPSPVASAPTIAKQEPVSAEDKSAQADCVRKVEQAQAAGIIKAIKSGFNIVVDETTWRRIPYDTKLGMAHTIGCAAVGPGKYIPLTFRSDLSNKVLGEFSGVSLKVM